MQSKFFFGKLEIPKQGFKTRETDISIEMSQNIPLSS